MSQWEEQQRTEGLQRFIASKKKAQARNRKYGFERGEYSQLLASQKYRCAICGAKHKEKPLVVDHDHKTNLKRGLLCGTCNSGLGFFADDPNRLVAAIAYLEKHGISL